MNRVTKFYNKMDHFAKISEVEFPKVRELSIKACEEGERVNDCMAVAIIRKYKEMYLRDIYLAIKMNTIKSRRKKLV